MPPLNSVIRRYTPPTCTLEIWAQSSPLSHLMGKTVIKQLSFELHFDAPQLPEERKILIRGDRDQLEILCDVVTNYVQNFLQQPPDNFWLSVSESPDSSKVSPDSELINFQQTSLPNPNHRKSFTSQTSEQKIYLEPGKYLTHNLFLGPLANHTSGTVIPLSLLQLFDLATALDEYSADVMALPNLHDQHKVLRLPTWAPIAAVLVLSVGLLPTTLQFANHNRQNQPEIAATTQPEETTTALEPSPSLEIPTLSPGLTVPENLTGLEPLESQPQLPTATFPEQPLVANSRPFTVSSSPLPSLQDPLLIFDSKVPEGERNSGTSTSQKFPPQPNFTVSIPESENLPQRRSLPPQLSANRDTLPNLASNRNNNISQSAAPADSPFNRQPFSERINSSVNIASPADNNSLVNPTTSQTVAAGSTLFDTPQVAEAREILKQRWQPPSGFTQTLEYSLMVNGDGSIEKIYPINQAARVFIEDVRMPEIGKPFVSAHKNGQMFRIRVVLSPDGRVQTFPEN
jgi:hypothetical protein